MWGRCILLYFYEQRLCHRIIFTIGHTLEIYICSTEFSSLWQMGFSHNTTLEKNLYFVLEFVKEKKKQGVIW